MNQTTNPVIEATARASELVYQTFAAIWNEMENGRASQQEGLTNAKRVLEEIRQRAEEDHKAQLAGFDVMLESIEHAIRVADDTASVMQNLVGSPPNEPGYIAAPANEVEEDA